MIRSDNLVLRAPELKDVDLLYAWENDQSLWAVSNTITPFSKFVLEQYVLNAQQDIYSAKQLRLMIELLDETTIGSIDLFDFDPHHLHAGIGIFIDKKFQKQGYASRALTLLIDYAFNTLQLHQLHCNITADNKDSIQLFMQHGFVQYGTRKQWIKVKDSWLDEQLFQLINV